MPGKGRDRTGQEGKERDGMGGDGTERNTGQDKTDTTNCCFKPSAMSELHSEDPQWVCKGLDNFILV